MAHDKKILLKMISDAQDLMARYSNPEDEVDGDELLEALYELLDSREANKNLELIRSKMNAYKFPITGTEQFSPDYSFHAERVIVDAIFALACPTLDPEQMGQLEEILEYLCVARNIPRTFERQ